MAPRFRYVLLGVAVLAAVVGLVLAHGLTWAMAALELPNPPLFGLRELSLATTLGYLLAGAAGLALLLQRAARRWAGEVVDELFRVNWPSREETTHATVVVMVCVVVCAAFLGVFDAAWLWLSGFLMGAPSAAG